MHVSYVPPRSVGSGFAVIGEGVWKPMMEILGDGSVVMFVMVQKGSDEYKWEDGSFVTWESCPEFSGGFVTWERGLESLMNEAKAAMLRRGKGILESDEGLLCQFVIARGIVSVAPV